MSRKDKVMIVEPSAIVTEGLTRILMETSDFEILPPADDIENLKDLLSKQNPDIVLLNPTMMPYSKHAAVYSVLQEFPHIAVVALVYQYVEATMLRSFHSILDVRESRDRIAEVLQEALSAVKTHRTSIESNSSELTSREIDVLVLVAKGLMSKEIADKLHISVHTVISHRKNITRKTNIKSVAGLAMYALMNNLIEEGEVL